MVKKELLAKTFRNLALPIALVCSLVFNVQLTNRLKACRRSLTAARGVVAGDRLPVLRARASTGELVEISYSGAPKGTLLYYFSPGCGWCIRNAANFKALVDKIGAYYQVVSYTDTLLGMDEFRQRGGHPGLIVTDDVTNIRRDLKLGGTPQTIVIDRAGLVVKAWEGAYSGRILKDIEGYFGVQLPGLQIRAEPAAYSQRR